MCMFICIMIFSGWLDCWWKLDKVLIDCVHSQCLCRYCSDEWQWGPGVQDNRFMVCCSTVALKADLCLTQYWLTPFDCCHGKWKRRKQFSSSVWMCNRKCGFKWQQGECIIISLLPIHHHYNFATRSPCSSRVLSAYSTPLVFSTRWVNMRSSALSHNSQFSFQFGSNWLGQGTLTDTERDERETDVQKRKVI